MSTHEQLSASQLTAAQADNVRKKLAGEITSTKRDLTDARKRLKKTESDYASAEKAESKAWAAHERSGRVKAQETWETAHSVLQRATVAKLGAFDHVSFLERRLATLTDPETLQDRLGKRASVEENSGIKDRTSDRSSGNEPKERNKMARTALTAIEAVLKVLKDNGGAMKMPDIIEKAVPLTALQGAHPGQTIYSVVYSEAKKGDSRVKQVAKGTFSLTENATKAKAQVAQASKATPDPKKKPAARRKPAGRKPAARKPAARRRSTAARAR